MEVLDPEIIRNIAANYGISTVGFRNLHQDSGDDSLNFDRQKLKQWQDAGYSAGMEYMKKPAEVLSSIKSLFPEARAFFFIKAYYSTSPVKDTPHGYGRVARYAWGKDYHKVLKKRLTRITEELRKISGVNFKSRIFTDAVPLMERAHARSSGLGFIGKNSMLIDFGKGSFSLLAGVVIDVELDLACEDISAAKLLKSRADKACGSCTSCITNCPTSAIVKDYTVDAGRCISYLTIEKRGVLKAGELESLGEWLFGCDICQEVCPYNSRQLKEGREPDLAEFGKENGAGQFLELQKIMEVNDHDEYTRLFNGTPLMRAKRSGLIRNAIAVAGNSGYLEVSSIINDKLRFDSEPGIRSAALWYAAQVAVKYGEIPVNVVKSYLEGALNDPDSYVKKEAQKIYEIL